MPHPLKSRYLIPVLSLKDHTTVYNKKNGFISIGIRGVTVHNIFAFVHSLILGSLFGFSSQEGMEKLPHIKK
jgi:hypothetical protein